MEQLERDTEALMRSYAAMAPDALDALDSEDRHYVYKILNLRVAVYADGPWISVGRCLIVFHKKTEITIFTH
jgi:hypothetical protein